MYWNKTNKRFIILMKRYSAVNRSTLGSGRQSTMQTPCKLNYTDSWLRQYTAGPLHYTAKQTHRCTCPNKSSECFFSFVLFSVILFDLYANEFSGKWQYLYRLHN
jgi:hypothetical protein